MLKPIDYILLSATEKKELTEKVRKWIGKGWEPQGGVAVSKDGDVDTFYQAVILRKEM